MPTFCRPFRLRYHFCVCVEVVELAGGAGSAVGDVDLHRGEVAERLTIGGIARLGHARHDGAEVDPVDAAVIGGIRVRGDGARAHRGDLLGGWFALARDPLVGALVGLADPPPPNTRSPCW